MRRIICRKCQKSTRYSLDSFSTRLVLAKRKTQAENTRVALSRSVLTSHSKIIQRLSLNYPPARSASSARNASSPFPPQTRHHHPSPTAPPPPSPPLLPDVMYINTFNLASAALLIFFERSIEPRGPTFSLLIPRSRL